MILLTLIGCLTRENFPEQYAAALCDYEERCDIPPAGGDQEECPAYRLERWDTREVANNWTPAEGADCLDAVASRACGAAEPGECDGVWSGGQ